MTGRAAASASSRAVLRLRDFRLYLTARGLSGIAMQMQSVAIGWQVYDITQDPLALGFVGLAQFLPMAGTLLPAGDAADRFDRRVILAASALVQAACAAALLVLTLVEAGAGWAFYAVLVAFGAARGFAAPSQQSFAPLLVPQAQVPAAVAWSSSVHQAAFILGPAVGGGIYVFGAAAVYATCLVAFLAMSVAVIAIATRGPRYQPGSGETALIRFLAGIAYMRAHPMILGAIALDLFAVLLGGATALLPIFARDVLHVGAEGLGALRSAQAIGATGVAFLLAARPLRRHAGAVMLVCVALFGAAAIVFGLSESFVLSLVALIAMGATDMVSVFVRMTLIQLATPDTMRGRVSAVNMLFVGASNELGEFRAGLMAAWIGAVPAVVVGGIGTVAVVAACARLFPDLRKVDRLLDVRPSAR